MSKCPKCLAENSSDAKFCRECASPLTSSGGKTCPNGKHIMDPNWSECTYCRSEGLLGTIPSFASGAANTPVPLRNPTVVEGRLPGPAGLPPRQPTFLEGQLPGKAALPPRQPTYLESQPLTPRSMPKPFVGSQTGPLPAPQLPSSTSTSTLKPKLPRNATVFSPMSPSDFTGLSMQPAQQPSPTPPSLSAARKMVGILVTYSWRPEGQIFPLREGRNLIGRDPDCDVCIPEDQTMSGRNSHITFRQNFVVGDLVSMMGTDLNSVPIEEQFKSLANYSIIRAGSTHFTFIMIDLPQV